MKTLASKTASVRLPKEMFEEIDDMCDGIGCTRNDWIKDTLQDKLREESSEETEDQEIKSKPKPKQESRPEPSELRNLRIVEQNTDKTIPKAQSYTITLDDGTAYHYKDGKKIEEPLKDTSKPKVVINLDDPQEPKTIDNSRLPPIQMIRDINGKLSLFAKRYNT